MAASDKNILISPQRGSTTQVPSIVFTGDGNDPISLRVLDGVPGSLSFEGGAGQLFSLTDDLTSGSIFSVNDVSGLPSLDVNANGRVQIAPFGGTVAIGQSTVTAGQTVDIKGNLRVDGTLTITSTANIANLNADSLDGLNSTQFLRSDTSGTLSGALTFSHPSAQIILDNSAQADPRWALYSWTSGLNIYPIDAASTIFIGRDGQSTTVDLFNISNVAVAGVNILSSSRQLSNVTFGGNTIWHAGNDGSGSGLDADLLDGLNVTSANTVSTVVSRDASGNFSAGTITATLSGSSSSLALTSGVINSSAWAGGTTYHGYTYTGGNYRFGFSSTSGVVDVYADGNFYATDSSHLVWHAGTDGAGSGLDADLLDGENLVDNASTANTVVGRDSSGNIISANLQAPFQVLNFDTQKAPGLYHYDGAFTGTRPPDNSPNYRTIEIGNSSRYTEVALPWNSANMYFRRNTDGVWSSWSTVWHNDNDGSGSGLDADLLDGINSTAFLRSNVDTSASGIVDFTGGSGTNPAVRIRSGGSSWSEGLAIHPSSDNGFALSFFRTRSSFTDSTNTWAIGNLGTNSTNNFGLLRNGLSGGSGVRGDSIFDVTQAGTFRFGFTPTVGANTVWHAGNDGSGSGLDADLLDGFQWDSSGKNVRATEFYADNWFRNYNSGEGLYNEATAMHWYSDANWRFRLYSTSATSSILFTTNGDTARGYVYADTGSSIGFLNVAGEWGLRYLSNDGNSPNLYFREEANETWTGDPGSDIGKIEYHSNRFYIAAGSNSTEVVRFRRSGSDVAIVGNDGAIYSPIYYDWNNSGFYADPASTSIFNTLNLSFLQFDGRTTWDTASTAQNGSLSLGYLTVGTGWSKIYRDEDFNNGNNSIALYNNAGGTALSFARISDSTAPNSSRQILRFTYNGGSNGTTPGFGGFYFATGTSVNKTLVCRFKAKLKSGSQFDYHSNAIGDNGTQFWVTSRSGSGKWEEYVSVVMCGNAGTFSSTHFYAVSGGSFTNGEVLFDLASATVYDVTDNFNVGINRLYADNDIRTPILYDSNNTAYYIDPNGTTSLRTTGDWRADSSAWTGEFAGKIQYHNNNWYFQYQTEFIFRNASGVNTCWGNNVGDVWGGNSLRSPIYYDSGNTGYYIDAASTSRINTISLDQVNTGDGTYLFSTGATSGTTRHLNLSSYGGDPSQAHTGQSGISWGYRGDSQAYYMIHLTHGDYSAHTKLTLSWHTGIRIGAAPEYGGTAFYNNSLNVGPSLIFSVGRGDSHVRVTNNLYAPIMYDSDNTGYYCDPSSTSSLYHLVLSGAAYFRPQNWIQMDGSYGMYWPNTNGAHLEGNTLSSYGSIAIRGTRNGWKGIHFYEGGNTPHLMFDGVANGGIYFESGGRWASYYNYANNCWGYGTSSTNSAYNIWCPTGVYSGGRVDGTIFYDSTNTAYYCDPNGRSSFVAIDTSGGTYNIFRTWTDLPGYHGLYSSVHNSAHFYPNNATYGSWRIDGSRNGWSGIHFGSGSTLMMNSTEVGFHSEGNGWQMRWQGGTGYVHKGSAGGGTAAVILDSSNWSSYVSGGATLSNDTTTNATYYPTFSNAISGTYSTAYVSSTKCTFNPSTGTLSATIFTSLSDFTQKKNIQNITNAIELTKQINGVRFDWKETDESSAGVIAQEVEEVLPEIVHTNDDGIKSVNYNGVVGLLIEAIKEQQKQIDDLRSEINNLKKPV